MMAKATNLLSENTMVRNELETSSKTYAEAKVVVPKLLCMSRDGLGKKTRECVALRAKLSVFEKALATLHEVHKVDEEWCRGSSRKRLWMPSISPIGKTCRGTSLELSLRDC